MTDKKKPLIVVGTKMPNDFFREIYEQFIKDPKKYFDEYMNDPHVGEEE